MPAVAKWGSNSGREEFELRRGPWTLEEDTLLIKYINCHGEGHWNMLAKCAGLKRTGKSCRLRWLNYLKPDIKRGNLSPQEQLLILELHSKWGNRWSKIAQHLPGRTDNEIKNYWRTRVQKQARQLNIESNSKRFLDAVRCFWMPRLIQMMEQNSPTSDYLNSAAPSLSSTSSVPSLSSSSPPPPPCKLTTNPSNHLSESPNFITSTNNLSQDCTKIPQFHQVLEEQPASFSQTLTNGGSDNNNIYLNQSFPEDNTDNYGMTMEGIHLAPFSSLGIFDFSELDNHTAAGYWLQDSSAGSLWSLENM